MAKFHWSTSSSMTIREDLKNTVSSLLQLRTQSYIYIYMCEFQLGTIKLRTQTHNTLLELYTMEVALRPRAFLFLLGIVLFGELLFFVFVWIIFELLFREWKIWFFWILFFMMFYLGKEKKIKFWKVGCWYFDVTIFGFVNMVLVPLDVFVILYRFETCDTL